MGIGMGKFNVWAAIGRPEACLTWIAFADAQSAPLHLFILRCANFCSMGIGMGKFNVGAAIGRLEACLTSIAFADELIARPYTFFIYGMREDTSKHSFLQCRGFFSEEGPFASWHL